MSLHQSHVRATIAVSDINRAEEFYETKLGLIPTPGTPGALRIYECGGGSQVQVYESPDHAGKATATVASWSVTEFDAVVDQLLAAGITFERYEAIEADERGVHDFDGHNVIWFRDPDGNTIAVDNGLETM